MTASEDEDAVMVQDPSAVEESDFEDSHQIDDPVEELALPEILPVMPLRDVVIFPGMMVPLIVSREQSVELVDDVVVNNKLIALVAQKSPEIEDPTPDDIFEFGTVGIVLKMLKFPDGSVRILVQGLNRVCLNDFIRTSPYMVARVSETEESGGDSREVAAKDRHLSSQFQKFLELNPQAPQELQVILMNIEDPGRRADIVASTINVAIQEK
ncbi:MAG: LON peptidase substrate-binding domain-containing protein, partial [Planctomycetota bacterium]|nr:LON peptidase substrate-binding domain-containing protein [Planctomycetota bacterium]